jgi:hypothetical protein
VGTLVRARSSPRSLATRNRHRRQHGDRPAQGVEQIGTGKRYSIVPRHAPQPRRESRDRRPARRQSLRSSRRVKDIPAARSCSSSRVRPRKPASTDDRTALPDASLERTRCARYQRKLLAIRSYAAMLLMP